ncbi:hypothetical protein PTSG_02488 [Salpingoeca rosetta]|uniref:PH domain-containing protein n=1 Tax=Salpingoeca rosetta (strain ATCC 50818 / BSB-021) TaxID=946362 RepID=F2U2C3_SALR5|nr:uncharacterized protein PTSG_02488 [Salpingoeca rosetta]EGD81775.1 hypothetical protein PTSG_02488 [Salpingoeca rosetta]|eukprot:XP_004996979.1 hypothetical protein PTSG_02488 [Salpingoeca rosetta]
MAAQSHQVHPEVVQRLNKAEAALHDGVLMKQGSILKNWKERHFVLYSSGQLRYFKQRGHNRRVLRGSIDLHQCTGMTQGRQHTAPPNGWPPHVPDLACLAIHAPRRTYYFYATNRAEMDVWLAHLDPFVRRIRHAQPEYQNLNADLP